MAKEDLTKRALAAIYLADSRRMSLGRSAEALARPRSARPRRVILPTQRHQTTTPAVMHARGTLWGAGGSDSHARIPTLACNSGRVPWTLVSWTRRPRS